MNNVTTIYKTAQYKMPCHNYMVLHDNLNNMNLVVEKIVSRTPERYNRSLVQATAKIFLYTLSKMSFGNFHKSSILQKLF